MARQNWPAFARLGATGAAQWKDSVRFAAGGANTLAEQLVRQRTSLGFSQKESAERLGVDPSTLAKWEQGKREPQGAFAKRAERFLVADASSSATVAKHGVIATGAYLVDPAAQVTIGICHL